MHARHFCPSIGRSLASQGSSPSLSSQGSGLLALWNLQEASREDAPCASGLPFPVQFMCKEGGRTWQTFLCLLGKQKMKAGRRPSTPMLGCLQEGVRAGMSARWASASCHHEPGGLRGLELSLTLKNAGSGTMSRPFLANTGYLAHRHHL